MENQPVLSVRKMSTISQKALVKSVHPIVKYVIMKQESVLFAMKTFMLTK